MVTAGVYLIVRLHPLFQLAPTAGEVGAIVGCAAHLFCVLADRDEVAGESKVTIGRRNRCS